MMPQIISLLTPKIMMPLLKDKVKKINAVDYFHTLWERNGIFRNIRQLQHFVCFSFFFFFCSATHSAFNAQIYIPNSNTSEINFVQKIVITELILEIMIIGKHVCSIYTLLQKKNCFFCSLYTVCVWFSMRICKSDVHELVTCACAI